MISNISLINFKCFSRESIPLGKLTLLTGLNGMGKSSVIQAILILAQSMSNGEHTRGRILTKGKYVDLGTPSDILFDDAKTNSIAILLSNTTKTAAFRMRATKSPQHNNKYALKNQLSHLKFDELEEALSPQKSDSCIAKFQYLQAERNGPRKFLPTANDPQGSFEIGSQGEYVLHLLALYGSTLLEHTDARTISADGFRLTDQTEAWLNLISPGISIQLKTLYDADLIQPGFSFSTPGNVKSRAYRATNVGFGISYVLPVIVALLATPKGGLVIIENPEAHLHPQGQTYLGELCARAAKSGIQVIIESHSDHFMDGIRIAVREKVITPGDARLHYFYRAGTKTSFKTPVLDDNGRLSEWPEGFNDQHRRNAVQLLKPLPKE
ncbi:AAA family ATPase [Pseudomonas putida]|uniref:AAA family ATPase n=1 Tax=Pseudomonas putida TaxID=303 RepID=UPI0039E11A64